ncbi:AN1-type zinc finger protein 2A-like isoform X2 [Dendronephthya gigantea]|nr:AN1-type zinc finger protein 2A-like isoform X2 [Dendronephthya gigantea]XP_028401497.1 AN1-type zinc finger protein 2A-like isoform X2 [Dendronephthya gigantea]
MNCDACEKTFCNDHVTYYSHNCQSAYKKDVQVPVCPLCNKPVPVNRGEPPDIKVGEHIDRDCESDPAKEKRKLNSNRCSAKGCKKNELVPVLCDSCRRNYCLRHRHPQDHDCATARKANYLKAQTTKNRTGTAQVERNKPQQTPLSVLGRELDRARRERANPSNINTTNQQQPSRTPQGGQQRALSDDEALALAIQASLADTSSTADPAKSSSSPKPSSSTKPSSSQEEEDRALAQALADSEKETRNRQRQEMNRRRDEKTCTMS